MKYKVLKEVTIGGIVIKPGAIVHIDELNTPAERQTSKEQSAKNKQIYLKYLWDNQIGTTYLYNHRNIKGFHHNVGLSFVVMNQLLGHPDMPELVKKIHLSYYLLWRHNEYKDKLKDYLTFLISNDYSGIKFEDLKKKQLISIYEKVMEWIVDYFNLLTFGDYMEILNEFANDPEFFFTRNAKTLGINFILKKIMARKIKTPKERNFTFGTYDDGIFTGKSVYFNKNINSFLELFNSTTYLDDLREYIYDVLDGKSRREVENDISGDHFTWQSITNEWAKIQINRLKGYYKNVQPPYIYREVAQVSTVVDVPKAILFYPEKMTFSEHARRAVSDVSKMKFSTKNLLRHSDFLFNKLIELIYLYNKNNNINTKLSTYEKDMRYVYNFVGKTMYMPILKNITKELFNVYNGDEEYELIMRFIYERNI